MIGIKLITFTCDFIEEDRGRARIARPGERERAREGGGGGRRWGRRLKKKHAVQESHFQRIKGRGERVAHD